nr:hypothetical protein [Dechloromonas sp.]
MKTPELHLKCVFDPDDGSFGGILYGGSGTKIGPVTGRIDPPSLLTVEQKKPPGRKAGHRKDIAAFAHTTLAMQFHRSTVRHAQMLAADALLIGSPKNPDDQKRAIQRHIAKARKILDVQGAELVYFRTPEIESGLWFLFERGTRVSATEQMPDGTATAILRGQGWMCEWGNNAAKYGSLTLRFNGQTDSHISTMTEMLSG